MAIKRTNYFFPLPHWQHLTRKEAACCQSPPTPVLASRVSAIRFGMCQDLWDTHTLGEKRRISRLVAFLHWLSDIAIKKHQGYIATVLFVVIYSLAKSYFFFFPCGFLLADRLKTGQWSHIIITKHFPI